MEDLLGTSLTVFIGITVLLIGFASYMTGQALANTWRPAWQIVPYGLLLACTSRFLIWGLFGGELFSVTGYVLDALVLLAIAVGAYRATKAYKMVSQYPWLYERAGLFAWREKS